MLNHNKIDRRGETDTEEGWVKGLDAAFRAAVSHRERGAASDLAFSLAQDVPLRRELLRLGGCVVTADGGRIEVHLAGVDFVAAGPLWVPLGRAVIQLGGSAPVTEVADVWLGRLRRWARARTLVAAQVAPGGRWIEGALIKAAADHVAIETRQAAVAVPLELVGSVRLVPGG